MSGSALVVAAVFSALVLLRAAAVAFLLAFIIRPVRACPACFEPTVPVRIRWLRPLRAYLEWRWCPACRWEGPARRWKGAGRAGVRRPEPLPEPEPQ